MLSKGYLVSHSCSIMRTKMSRPFHDVDARADRRGRANADHAILLGAGERTFHHCRFNKGKGCLSFLLHRGDCYRHET